MSEELKPCPLCGSTNLKHYVTQARGGTMRGVVVCETCGCRLEHYTDHVHFIAEAYGGDWKSANEYAREDARIKVAQRWNRRVGRTCRPEVCDDGAGAWGVYCSECGYRFAGPHGNREVPEHMATRRDIMPRYCPSCGARVEEEVDE